MLPWKGERGRLNAGPFFRTIEAVTRKLAISVRLISACFLIAMLSIMMLDMGGQPSGDARYPHYWFAQSFGYIPALFVLAGCAGLILVAPSLSLAIRLVTIAYAVLNTAMFVEVGLEASFRSYRDLPGAVAFGISLALYLLLGCGVQVASKPRTLPEGLKGSPYPR